MIRRGLLELRIEGGFYVFLVAVGLLFLIQSVAGLVFDSLPSLRSAITEPVIAPYLASALPKPRESFVAFVILAAMPLVSLFLAIETPSVVRLRSRGAARIAAPLAAAVLLFAPLSGSDFLDHIGRAVQGVMTPTHWLEICVATALALCSWLVLRPWTLPEFLSRRTTTALCLTALTGLMLVQMCAWRVIRISSITADAASLDAVAYEISQAFAGRTVLVDFPSQYGLYPAFLAPVLHLTGLSVLRVSLIFAAMQAVSMVTLFAVILHAVRYRMIAVLAGAALVMVTFETVLHVAHLREYYFQYWPIRFFWPALSVGAFALFARRRTVISSLGVSLVSTVGLAWNTDTGLFIGLSHAAYLAFSGLVEFLDGNQSLGRDGFGVKSAALSLVGHAALIVSGYAAILALLSWNAGAPINLGWLIEYPRIFVGLGLMMLPIPPAWHPWISICGIYVLGLVMALRSWTVGRRSSTSDILFYVSMLGIGMLVYYSGRAHVFNLISVCWPAVITLAILSDQALRAIRGGLLSRWLLPTPALGIAALMFPAACAAYLAPTFISSSWDQFKTRGTGEDPIVLSELRFMNENASGRKCLILSQRQGIYYLETGFQAPLRGPGVIETLLQTDADALAQKIAGGHLDCFFLGLGPYSGPIIGPSLEQVVEHYSVVAENDEHTMVSLKPR